LILLLAGTLASCAGSRSGLNSGTLQSLLASRDYFTMRERLIRMSGSPDRLVAEAAVLNAFNQPAASNEAIDRLLASSEVDDELRLELTRIQRANFIRLHRFDDAYRAAREALLLPPNSAEKRRDDQNIEIFLRALRDVAPQTAVIGGTSEVRPDSAGHYPILINGHTRAFALDTGANFSVLMRSEAAALGLEIRPAGFQVGTSTDINMLADVAIADSVRIGSVRYRNVVFLVFNDRALTFPNEFEIRGLIGFPLIEAMREVHFLEDGSLQIPARPVVPAVGNLALDGLDPLIQVRWRRSDLICRLDSGANKTAFYEPFYRRFKVIIDRTGEPHRSQTGGVGGVREFDVRVLPRTRITVGTRTVHLEDVRVHVEPLLADEKNYLDCNVGRDVLEQFGEYALNFESMSLVLR